MLEIKKAPTLREGLILLGLIASFEITSKSLKILPKLINSIKINKSKSESYIDEEMKMTDKVYGLVSKGVPFRDAYTEIKNTDDLSDFSDSVISGMGGEILFSSLVSGLLSSVNQSILPLY